MNVAWAGSTEVVSLDVQTTNYTGFVIAADAVTGHVPDRSEITGAFALDFTWDGGDAVAVNYEALFRFEDENGVAQPIVDSAGGPQVTEISSVNQVTMSSSHVTNSRAFTVAFEPATRLLPHKHYTLKARWRKIPVGGSYTAYVEVPVDSSAAATSDYYHFNSTTSNDAATNAQIRVTLKQWDRPWMIAGSATQGSIQFVAQIHAVRYDAFQGSNTAADVPVRLLASLKNSLGVTVWTSPTTVDTGVSVDSHQSTFNPASVNITAVVDLVPSAGVLNAGETYTPVIQVTHDDGAGFIADGTTAVAPRALMRLAGTLSFGNIETTFDQLFQNPSEGMTFAPPTCTFVIPANHGFITGAPDTFYSGTLNDVQIEPSGHAIYTSEDAVPVSGTGLTKVMNGVNVVLEPSLSSIGASGHALVIFPDGFSLAPDITAINWEGRYRFIVDAFGDALALPSSLSVPGEVFCHCDQMPLIMQTSSLSFNGLTGRFVLSSGTWRDPLKPDKDYLAGAFSAESLANPLAAYRPSNIFHYGLVEGDSFSNVEVSADVVGRARFQSAHLYFGSGFYAPHFPQMLGIGSSLTTAITGGSLTIIDGAITSASTLNVGVMTLLYARDMATGPCVTSAGPGALQITPIAPLKFTADGGLVGDVTINSPTPVRWGALPTEGEFAHQLPPYAEGTYHMPGHRLAGYASYSIDRDQRPVAMLYTGAEESGYMERPDDESYSADGQANYAGITLRGAGNGTALSRLAGLAATYELSANSRYYIRNSGVTGITDATSGFSVAPIYGGMALDLNSYRLAFIDNLNTNSATTGSLSVGSSNPSDSPVDLQFAFTKLFFGPQGQLTASELSPSELSNTQMLRYWKTTFKPLAMNFRQPVPVNGSCVSPSEGFLSLAVEATLPLLPNVKVQGVLGFKGNGDLLGKGDALTEGTGIDSRFQLPSNVSVASAGGVYTLQPVVRAYLNRWDHAGLTSTRPANGFLSVAGRLDVPFFEAMKLHVHADSVNNVFFMGGWGESDDEAGSLGWNDAGKTYFNKAEFDVLNVAFPGNNLNDYRNDATEDYNPRVFKSWFDMVDFDYSLKRSPTGGFFQSIQPKPATNLLLFTLKSEITRLTPTAAEINFDANLQPTLPNLSMSSLVSSTGLADGIASKFSMALGGFDVASLTSALGGVDGLVRDSLADSIGPQIEAGMSPVVDAIYAQLQSSYAAAGNDTGSALIAALQAPGVVESVAINTRSTVSSLVNAGASGLTANAADRVGALKTQAQTLASAVQGISATAATLGTAVGVISGGNAGPVNGVTDTLNAAAADLNAVVTALESMETQLRTANGALFTELGTVATAQTAGVNAIASKTMQDVAGMVLLLNAPQGQLFTEYPEAEMKRRIRSLVTSRFFASPVASEYQRIFKSYLNPLRDSVQKQMDQIMAELETASRQALNIPPTPSLAQGANFASVLRSKGLHGFARINGDSLETLRLDGDFTIDILSSSDEAGGGSTGMSLKAWLEIQAVHSNSTASACNGLGGAEGLTVELGAKDVPIGWGTASGKAYASVKFGFDESATPISFDGSLGMNGTFDTGGFQFSEPKIVLGAGPDSLYAGFALRAAFNGKEVAARAVLGQICGLTPLQIIDPKAADVVQGIINSGHPELATHPLLGGSLYAEAWFPLNELIGIPTTCLLNLRAGMGAGFMCWKPIGTSGIIVGTQQFMGLSGEVLCCINVTGSLSMTGAGFLGDPPVINMKGIGSVSAEIGICPLCEDFSKSISAGATFNLRTGTIKSTGFNF